MSAAGDVNADGYDDFIVGELDASPGGMLHAGSAFVFSGLDGTILYQKNGYAAGVRFGYSVSDAGDVNNDGYGDFLVGAYVPGIAYVYSGLDGALLYEKNANSMIAISVAGAGDVNKDGYDDFIVGGSGADPSGRADAGSAYVFSGVDGSLLYDFYGATAFDQLGREVSGAGDVDGDGYGDFIIGTPYADPGGRVDAGSVHVYSGLTGLPILTLHGESSGDYFGYSVSRSGDVNKDGYEDILVGAVWNDAAGTDGGRAYLFLGGNSLSPSERDASTADWIITASDANSEFGESVRDAGDVNGDCHADFIVGASGASGKPGHAYVFFGSNEALPHLISASNADLIFDGDALDDEFGNAVSGIGDVNNDGSDDVIVSAFANDVGGEDAGQVYVYDCIASNCPPPITCYDRTVDANCDGVVNVQDVVLTVGVAFRGIPESSIAPCTTDPTP